MILKPLTLTSPLQVSDSWRRNIESRMGWRQSAIPIDAVTRSGSGLDPHISPANAALQVARVLMREA